MEKIDLKDRQILSLLAYNGRMPISEIARKTRLSKPVVHYRLNRLVKEGIIYEFMTVIDFTRLGYNSFEVGLQLNNSDPKVKEELINYLAAHPNTRYLGSCTGKWDIAVAFLARNVSHFSEIFYNDILKKHGKLIQNYYVNIVYDFYSFPRSYLANEKRKPTEFAHLGGDRPREQLTQNEISLLNKIAIAARTPIVTIANELGLSPKTVVSMMKDLHRRGIITNFQSMIEPSKIGRQMYDILIEAHNMTKEREEQLLEWAKNNQNIIYFFKSIGKWNLVFVAELKDFEHLIQFTIDLRRRFADIIMDYEEVQYTAQGKANEFPKDLLSAQSN